MSGILLTKSSGGILGPVATLLGHLMNGIFIVLEKLNIPNIGLAIILFVVIVYLLMMPLTIKQQKFSKLQAKMNPELQAIQKKYEGKRDETSIMAMNEEQRAVYKKYGVSPTGSCLQLLIQMPILLALYRVIYDIPAYVDAVKGATAVEMDKYNNFLGINVSNTPSDIVKSAFESNEFLLVIGALAIPVFAALSQFLSVKLMPGASNKKVERTGNDMADSMAQSMRMMNYTMPIMSAVLCYTLPAGMGIYWVAGSVVRIIQQIAINRYIDTIDFDEVIKKNQEKEAKKVKKEVASSTVVQNASLRTKSSVNFNNGMSQKEKDALIEAAKQKNAFAKSGSMASKVNMVKDYNEKNNMK